MATPAKENNRPEAQTKESAYDDYAAQQVSRDLRKLQIDRPKVIETDSDQDGEQWYSWRKHSHGGSVLLFSRSGTFCAILWQFS
ncbi:MAG TPA: hypothetical protein VFA61_13860 [Candidatus Udaeobacter sp.]|nr:hypothetical protein [Candidatus Udaeobacter sp.]